HVEPQPAVVQLRELGAERDADRDDLAEFESMAFCAARLHFGAERSRDDGRPNGTGSGQRGLRAHWPPTLALFALDPQRAQSLSAARRAPCSVPCRTVEGACRRRGGGAGSKKPGFLRERAGSGESRFSASRKIEPSGGRGITRHGRVACGGAGVSSSA